MELKNSDTLSVIHRRKSVRHFTGQSVKKEDLLTLIKAGMAAPSAVNCQPWEFIVVTDRKKLDKLAEGLPYAKMLFQAGAAIVVCGVQKRAYDNSKDYAIIDASLASENILLAAEALELGALWTAVYPYDARLECVYKTLDIPKEVIPLNVIPIGIPEGIDEPKNKYNESYIHWEKW